MDSGYQTPGLTLEQQTFYKRSYLRSLCSLPPVDCCLLGFSFSETRSHNIAQACLELATQIVLEFTEISLFAPPSAKVTGVTTTRGFPVDF